MIDNPASGWRKRATIGRLFKPTLEAFEFAVINSWLDNRETLTLALFTPNHAVDSQGHTLTLEQADFHALVGAASAVAALPQTFQ